MASNGLPMLASLSDYPVFPIESSESLSIPDDLDLYGESKRTGSLPSSSSSSTSPLLFQAPASFDESLDPDEETEPEAQPQPHRAQASTEPSFMTDPLTTIDEAFLAALGVKGLIVDGRLSLRYKRNKDMIQTLLAKVAKMPRFNVTRYASSDDQTTTIMLTLRQHQAELAKLILDNDRVAFNEQRHESDLWNEYMDRHREETKYGDRLLAEASYMKATEFVPRVMLSYTDDLRDQYWGPTIDKVNHTTAQRIKLRYLHEWNSPPVADTKLDELWHRALSRQPVAVRKQVEAELETVYRDHARSMYDMVQAPLGSTFADFGESEEIKARATEHERRRRAPEDAEEKRIDEEHVAVGDLTVSDVRRRLQKAGLDDKTVQEKLVRYLRQNHQMTHQGVNTVLGQCVDTLNAFKRVCSAPNTSDAFEIITKSAYIRYLFTEHHPYVRYRYRPGVKGIVLPGNKKHNKKRDPRYRLYQLLRPGEDAKERTSTLSTTRAQRPPEFATWSTESKRYVRRLICYMLRDDIRLVQTRGERHQLRERIDEILYSEAQQIQKDYCGTQPLLRKWNGYDDSAAVLGFRNTIAMNHVVAMVLYHASHYADELEGLDDCQKMRTFTLESVWTETDDEEDEEKDEDPNSDDDDDDDGNDNIDDDDDEKEEQASPRPLSVRTQSSSRHTRHSRSSQSSRSSRHSRKSRTSQQSRFTRLSARPLSVSLSKSTRGSSSRRTVTR